MILPSQKTVDQSYIKDYQKKYEDVQKDPEAFWSSVAHELTWFKPWEKTLDWQFPYARWFVGGKCNIVQNALDRHLQTSTKDKIAYIWEAQDGNVKTFTYAQLNEFVSRLANGLKSLGISKGDKVSIYLPRIPEQFIAMLACAKIGAVHSVVFSGFSAEALKNRIVDAEAKLLITCDGYPYGKKFIELKKNADEAIKDLPQIQHVVVVNRINQKTDRSDTPMTLGRDLWWDELISQQSTECPTEIMDANDPLFILYTSGTTGKPKGIIHGHGGYMVGTYITTKWVFNMKDTDVYFCTADAGWITGHSYIVYGPLMNGATVFVYEGTPDFPDPGKWWSLVEKHKITILYTAPTAVRALMRFGEEWPKKYDLSSLKLLGTVGEPINPEAWLWYHKHIGAERCPIVDTWWQTETGMQMITPLPSVPLKPGSAFKPFFGIEAEIVDKEGKPVPTNTEGFLVIRRPWPAQFLDVYKNPKRYRESYFEEIKPQKLETGDSKLAFEAENPKLEHDQTSSLQPPVSSFKDFIYFTGDSAKRDEDGYYWIIGRNDDVIKVSGHRLGSAELESAFVANASVAEAAVIGKPHEVKGESIKAFIILKQGVSPSDALKKELIQQIRTSIGPIATPDEMEFVEKLPKTRSGKIMRRVLRAQELGQPVGDTSTLEN